VVRVPGYRSRVPGSIHRHYKIFWEVISLVSTIEELLERKSSGSGLENREYGRRDPSSWPRGTLYLQKLVLTFLTSAVRSVGIFHSRTKVRGVCFLFTLMKCFLNSVLVTYWSRDIAVGVRTGYSWTTQLRFPAVQVSLFRSFQTGSGAHPISYPIVTVICFPGVKQPVPETDRSPPSTAELRNCEATAQLAYMTSWRIVELMKHRDNCWLINMASMRSCSIVQYLRCF
jgi:hypothetical protein